MICPYSDPPTPLYSPPGHYQDSSARANGQYDSTQTIDHPHIHDSQQLPLPNKIPSPAHPALTVPVGIITSVENPQALSERRNKQTRVLANGLELPLRCRSESTPSPPFVLTLCVYHPTSVCNFYLSYSNVFAKLYVRRPAHGI